MLIQICKATFSHHAATAALIGVMVLVGACASTETKDLPKVSDDGLTLVEGTTAWSVYVQEGTDFSAFNRIAIMDVKVAFKKNWMRDQNQSRASLSHRVTQKDADRIKQAIAEQFQKVFTEELENGGYSVVDYETDDNVEQDLLVLGPNIVDLDVTAPDVRSAGRSRTYTASAGSMTLYLELFDSVTGSLLGRVVDAQAARDNGYMRFSNSVTNKAEADRIMRKWAKLLVAKLDEVHGK